VIKVKIIINRISYDYDLIYEGATEIKGYKNYKTIINFDLINTGSRVIIEDANIHFNEEISDVDEMKERIRELFNEDVI